MKYRNVFIVMVVLLFCFSLLFFLFQQPAESRLNLILISLDTVRPDHLGCYGYPLAQTTNIDWLASQGVFFRGGITSVPVTLPAHCSVMTGKEVFTHGVRSNGVYRLLPEHVTLAELLVEEGYRTGAVVGAFPLERRFGLSQGFEIFDDDFNTNQKVGRDWRGFQTGRFERSAEEVTDLALSWLKDNSTDLFFLWVHYFDAHQPYSPPVPYAPPAGANLTARYDGEIAYVDSQFGRILSFLRQEGLLEHTLIVIFSDHGEVLGDYPDLLTGDSYNNHGLYINNGEVRVALIMTCPGLLPSGLEVEGLTRLSDMVPTVLDLLDLQDLGSFDGISLLPAITKGKTDIQEVYCEVTEETDVLGLCAEQSKLVILPEEKLVYVFSQLDGETEGPGRKLDFPLGPEYASWAEKIERFSLAATAAGRKALYLPDDQARRKLKALGYLN